MTIGAEIDDLFAELDQLLKNGDATAHLATDGRTTTLAAPPRGTRAIVASSETEECSR